MAEVVDSNLRFSNEQAITVSAISTNIVDGKALRDMGRGQPVYLNVYLTTVFTTSANSLTIQLVSSSAADPGASDVYMDVMKARLASAMLTTGLLLRMALPEDIPYQKLGLYFLATTALVAGKISAFLTLGQDSDARTTT
jgi:hypothetical protein